MADHIFMRFPADTGYIGAIRLAVSGIAGRMDYNVDEIEDLKTCVAEACILLLGGQCCEAFEINIEADGIVWLKVEAVDARADQACGEPEGFNEEISRLMIEALCENAAFEEQEGVLHSISFEKKHAAR